MRQEINETNTTDASCPSDQQLNSFLTNDGAQPDTVIIGHIDGCDTCQTRLAALTSKCLIASPSKLELPSYLSGLENKLAIASESTELPKPELPGYEILEVLGRGGMGVVYRARHIHLDREVALKVMAAGAHASPEYHRRLDREGQLLAKLNHPGIVQIFDSGVHNGLPFLALELIRHGNLAERREEFRSPKTASHLIEILARATDVAHRQGIVHRDLKPANILMEVAENERSISNEHCIHVDGTRLVPKIVDFGLSKASSESGSKEASVSKAMIGTPQYMSPEQATEDMERIGPATDIHALGVILYELLTGKRPFDGIGSLNTLQRIRTVKPVAPSMLNSTVDAKLNAIVLKCLKKDPGKRYGSATALALALSGYRSEKAADHVGAKKTVSLTRRTMMTLGLLGLLALSGWIIEISTNRGVIVVQCDHPGLEVTIRREGKAVDSFQVVDKENTKIVKSGNVQIEIPAQYLDTYMVSESSFELERNGKKIVTISKRQTDRLSKPDAKGNEVENHDTPHWEKMTQREIAKWAVSRNAEIYLSSHPHYDYLTHALPNEEVIVSGIAGLWHLTSAEMKLFEFLPELEKAGPTLGNYRGDALSSLNRCSKLSWLSLNASQITDKDLEIVNLDNIQFLMLTACNISGASLPKIAAAPKLRHLSVAPLLAGDPAAAIWFPKMSNIDQFEVYAGDDQAWGHVSKLPSVTKLKFAYSQDITDAGIESILNCPAVREIAFFQVDFRKADLRKLKGLKTLEQVWFNQCQLGEISCKELRGIFPKCKVTSALEPKE